MSAKILALAIVLASLIPLEAHARTGEKRGLETIVEAIETLEGKSDPKCHATATRLENFMYGSPLTTEARDRKVRLQKALIVGAWKAASADARAAGESAVSAERIVPRLREAVPYVRVGADVVVRPKSGEPLELTERDVRQYSSVAYALRAVLAVQQEVLLSPGLDLLPLAPDAVNAVKEAVDLATLATLQRADDIARAEEALEVTGDRFERAWVSVVGAADAPGVKVAREAVRSAELLRRIIEQKLASYRAYNQTEYAGRLMFNNVRSYYARHEWPSEKSEVDALTRLFTRLMMQSAAKAMERSIAIADSEGDAIVRERHVAAMLEETAPFDINEYEDITYFHHLPSSKRVVIESYDADSFRDSGLHWVLIRNALDAGMAKVEGDFDPFAAELLAEDTAQRGVLLYRVAGMIAKERESAVLRPEHLIDAAKRIDERMKEHLAAPPPARRTQKIASTPLASSATGGSFVEVSAKSGIEFVHRAADWIKRFERSFMYDDREREGADADDEYLLDVPPVFGGSGVAADDLDGDGLDDVLLLGGFGNKLYRNRGDGTFEDVSERAGLDVLSSDGKPAEPRQPLLVDLDNDGRRDIVITYVDERHRVYRNLGDFRFEDVSSKAGLGGKGLVGGAATALDFDRDGLLDLYIGYYGNYLKGDGPTLARINEGTTPNRLFRNRGNFVFEDVTEGSGADNRGWTQAVAAIDFDGDGWQDLIVGNDFGVNGWYRNLGNGKFRDVAAEIDTRHPSNSMNVGTADLNRDGYPDVYISNIFYMVKDEKYVLPTAETRMKRDPEKLATMRIFDANHLFASVAEEGRLRSYEFSLAVDRGDTSTGWAWDADFFDFDNDGDDDLYCVNGLNEYNIFRPKRFENEDGSSDYARPGYRNSANVPETNVFFVNEGGKLRNRSTGSGADLVVNSRSAAYLDFERDGDLDIVVNNYQEPAAVLENRAGHPDRHWMYVRLIGDPASGSNRDAIGATIVAETPSGGRIWRAVQGGTGYLSDHPKTQHIGLGSDETADVTVRWPNGEVTTHPSLRAGELHVIVQSEARSPALVAGAVAGDRDGE